MNVAARQQKDNMLLGMSGVGVIAGLLAAAATFAQGHSHAFNVTREIPWGVLVSAYEFLMILAAGLALLVSVGLSLKLEQYAELSRKALVFALASMAGGFFLIFMELDHPVRMLLFAVTSPNITSPLWWMGLFYGGMIAVILVQLFLLVRGVTLFRRVMGMAGVVATLMVLANMGSVLALLENRPFWSEAFVPVHFLISALITATSLGALLVFWERLRMESSVPLPEREFMVRAGRFLFFLLSALAFLIAGKLGSGLYAQPPGEFSALMTLLNGPLSLNFWLLEILVGLVLPLAILCNQWTRTPTGVVIAAALALIGSFFMRYDLVIAGQLVPMREGGLEKGEQLLSYFPSVVEFGLVVGSLGICLFLFILAEKFFAGRRKTS